MAVPTLRVRCRLRPFSVRRVTGHETTLPSGETLRIISAKAATSLEAEISFCWFPAHGSRRRSSKRAMPVKAGG
ncbi:hypothetical protein [Nitratireductor sp. XY-223]|uniref:hypothetical protein n=1 Tax=Nitratireductor sp. XY-223 TaxID=2561926 RepID=UPI001FEF3400|nr:hypothetical protein [Nitratireductor sp. XY-223]